VLSQDDRWQLAMIERRLEVEDPEFAAALAAGRPRCPRGDRRWPLRLAVGLAVLVFMVGLVTQVIWVMVLGVGASAWASAGSWVHVRRVQGRPVLRRRGSS
jgi:hypothetical protein